MKIDLWKYMPTYHDTNNHVLRKFKKTNVLIPYNLGFSMCKKQRHFSTSDICYAVNMQFWVLLKNNFLMKMATLITIYSSCIIEIEFRNFFILKLINFDPEHKYLLNLSRKNVTKKIIRKLDFQTIEAVTEVLFLISAPFQHQTCHQKFQFKQKPDPPFLLVNANGEIKNTEH